VEIAKAVKNSPNSSFTVGAGVMEEDWDHWVLNKGKSLKAFHELYTPQVQSPYIQQCHMESVVQDWTWLNVQKNHLSGAVVLRDSNVIFTCGPSHAKKESGSADRHFIDLMLTMKAIVRLLHATTLSISHHSRP